MVSLSRRSFVVAASASLGVATAGCLALGGSNRWSMFRGAGNNEASDRFEPGEHLGRTWTVEYADAIGVEGTVAGSSPVATQTAAFVAVRIGEADDEVTGTAVLAVDLETGEVDWRRTVDHPHPADTPFVHPPVLAEEYLFVVTGNRATVFDHERGRTALEIDLPWTPQTVPGGDRYLVALGGDLVAMVDLEEDRDIRWTRPDHAGRAIAPVNPLTVLDDRLYVPAADHLIAIRRGDGAVIWDEPLPGADAAMAAAPLVDGHHLHLRVRTDDGAEEHVALARGDRSFRWREPLGSVATDGVWPSAYRSGRLFATVGETLVGINVGNGDRAWDVDLGLEAPYPTVGGGTVYALGADALVAVDSRDGEEGGVVDLPGDPPTSPVEAVPREDVLLIGREDRLVGLADAERAFY